MVPLRRLLQAEPPGWVNRAPCGRHQAPRVLGVCAMSGHGELWEQAMRSPDLRAPARICPPCHGDCHQGRDCPALAQTNCVRMYDAEGSESHVHIDELQRRAKLADGSALTDAWADGVKRGIDKGFWVGFAVGIVFGLLLGMLVAWVVSC